MLLFLICFIRERMLFWVVMVNKWMFYLQNRPFSRPQNDPKLAPEMAPKVPPKWPWIGSWNGSWSERKPLPILKKSLPKRLPNRLPIPIFRDRESESGVTFFSLPILKKSLPKRLPNPLPNPLPIPIFRDRESESGVTFFLTPDSHSRSRSRFFGWKSLPICQKNRNDPKMKFRTLVSWNSCFSALKPVSGVKYNAQIQISWVISILNQAVKNLAFIHWNDI